MKKLLNLIFGETILLKVIMGVFLLITMASIGGIYSVFGYKVPIWFILIVLYCLLRLVNFQNEKRRVSLTLTSEEMKKRRLVKGKLEELKSLQGKDEKTFFIMSPEEILTCVISIGLMIISVTFIGQEFAKDVVDKSALADYSGFFGFGLTILSMITGQAKERLNFAINHISEEYEEFSYKQKIRRQKVRRQRPYSKPRYRNRRLYK